MTEVVKANHGRQNFFVEGEGIIGTLPEAQSEQVTQDAASRKFRFSRLLPKGVAHPTELLAKVAEAMAVDDDTVGPDSTVPAGFTYLGQFVDHDLTFDDTKFTPDTGATLAEIARGRTPLLDLDSLYGGGPDKNPELYQADKIRFDIGTTEKVGPTDPGGPAARVDLANHDLKRLGFGSDKPAQRIAVIGDERNDENLAVAQIHLAFLNFHQRVVDLLEKKGTPSTTIFSVARDMVVRHYQWMLKTDFLPRIVEPKIVDYVFANGRRVFETSTPATDRPTMPIEFSVASYRLGHSMIRESYEWNKVFDTEAGIPGTLSLLFRFSGKSGTLNVRNPPDDTFLRLPTNWVADYRRLFDFSPLGDAKLTVPADKFNFARPINTQIAKTLGGLPLGSIGAIGAAPPAAHRNLAFRNLARGGMLLLASGQDAVAFLNSIGEEQKADILKIKPLTAEQIIKGNGGAVLDALTDAEKDAFAAATPLWFYILREAEFSTDGKLTGVGARITAEVFHRAMEKSDSSIISDPTWMPTELSRDPKKPGTFEMIDLLHFAYEGKIEHLAPMG